MNQPIPTPIYRMMHIDNLDTVLQQGGLYAPNHVPDDGLPYRSILDSEIAVIRHEKTIPYGMGGTVHDYVPFYLGPRSPMLLRLHTDRVLGYDEGQKPIIYIVSHVEKCIAANAEFVFSDGHGIAGYTKWYAQPDALKSLDWNCIYADYWADTEDDNDRQRRKQAEFLIYEHCDWSLVSCIAVVNSVMKSRVEEIQALYEDKVKPVIIRRDWYF